MITIGSLSKPNVRKHSNNIAFIELVHESPYANLLQKSNYWNSDI